MKKITKLAILLSCTALAAAMTACGSTSDSNAAATTKAAETTVPTEAASQAEAQPTDAETVDFTDINGFGIEAEYGDPSAKGKNWDMTDSEAVAKLEDLLNESLSYEVDAEEAKSASLSKGAATWKVSDGKKYSITVIQNPDDYYNVKINKGYYKVPEDLMNELSDLIVAQKEQTEEA